VWRAPYARLTPPARASRPPQVEDAAGAQLLVRMPNKFNKMLWVKRGARPPAARARARQQQQRSHVAHRPLSLVRRQLPHR
jgi:hypothetical protein